MKFSHTCPKCRATDIVVVDGERGAYGSGNNIITGLISYVKVDRFICLNCGFTEEWIRKEDLQKVDDSEKSHDYITHK